ncbi:MAG: hypothetical protein D4R65_02710 [Verrucomicrobiaceae bacterium]|nr:MAG: hypothetical protein D4R65_02710 [Verrucomicrobiaceae bacterium]
MAAGGKGFFQKIRFHDGAVDAGGPLMQSFLGPEGRTVSVGGAAANHHQRPEYHPSLVEGRAMNRWICFPPSLKNA